MPLSNLYLAYSNCNDIVSHIEVDYAVILGFDGALLETCLEDITKVRRDVLLVARRIVTVNDKTINSCLSQAGKVLTGCKPMDIPSARRLAKVGNVLSLVLAPENLRFIDISEVNSLAQSPMPKYIEVTLFPFVDKLLASRFDVEGDFYRLGEVIERALKRDVGVVVSAASPNLWKALLTVHIDIALYSMGFSKRERRLILELYPMDFIEKWLETR